MDDKLKILTYNVKGLKGPEKRSRVLEWLKQKKGDIILIQESHFEESDRTKWKEEWEGEIISSQGTNQARGVCILLSKDLNGSVKQTFRDSEGRWVMIMIDIKNVSYCIVNYYGPNLDQTTHMEKMLQKINELNTNKVVIGGDFNFVYNVDIDKSGGNRNTNTKCRNTMVNWQQHNDARDIWRERNPNKRQYTWTSSSKPRIQCRLDHLIVTQPLAGLIVDCRISPGYASDHSLVSITLSTGKTSRGRGFWKFNSSLLNHEGFRDKISNCIKKTADENTPCSARLLWDITKCNIRRECIAYSCKLKKMQYEEEKRLEVVIGNMEEKRSTLIEKNQPAKELDQLEEQLQASNLELDKILQHKCRGAALRSKCKNFEFGEKASKYFLNLEKQKGDKQAINSVLKEDGSVTMDQKEILEEQYLFYQRLYEEKDLPLTDQLLEVWKTMFNIESPKVEHEDHPALTRQIEEAEIWKIVTGSPNEKSPGNDGLTHEFYKNFWEDIKEPLVSSYNEALENGEMCISQRRGVITLLPKDGKDQRLLKNWRPITLLNNDYKYLSKCIAQRCRDILPYIIGMDQCGFVKGRLIGFNILRLLDIIEGCKEENINGLLVNIDIEKAFDSVSWRFLYKALEYFNFPIPFIKWIQCLYKGAEVCTMNNGHTSKYINIGRGMRQGCPLSPILFVICIEIMSLYIQNTTKIEGIKVGQENHIISLFADDTSFFIKPEKENLETLFDCLELFGKVSGLIVNVEKTELFTLGNTKAEEIPPIYKNQIKESVKVLGCKIHNSIEETINTNYNEAFDKMLKAIDFWGKKPLSLTGKINMIKNQIAPKLLYCMTVLPSPKDDYWKRVEKELFSFVSNNKKEKLKRTTLINTHANGGAQMPDLKSQNSAIKATWFLRGALRPGPWTFRIRNKIGKAELLEIVSANNKYEDIKHLIPDTTIWKEAAINWCHINHRTVINQVDDILEESLWFNSNIKIGGKTLHRPYWTEHGIFQIVDLLRDDNRTFLTYREFSEKYKMHVNFLEYGGLKKAIPGTWRVRLRESSEDPDPTKAYEGLVNECARKKLKTKTIYTKLINQKGTKPLEKMNKWIQDLELDEEPNELIRVMEKTRRLTPYSKLQSFNYNYFHRNLVYEARRHKMGLADNDLCNICNKKESIVHLYWECTESQKLWSGISNLIDSDKLNKKECLIGQLSTTNKKDQLTGILTLVCRYYIHLRKCKNQKRSLKGLLNTIKNIRNIETTIYQGNPRKVRKWTLLEKSLK
jgi:exonuclease III